MIRGIHGLLYSSDADATRAFFKEKVKLPGTDVGEGWWIFDVPEGDLGFHPVDDPGDAGKHDVSFYCDDIHGTVAELKSRGVEFTQDVEDHGYGLVTHFTAPGGISVQLYEPRYTKASRAPRPSTTLGTGASNRNRPTRSRSKPAAKAKRKDARRRAAAKKRRRS